jgi:hypothetical protein
LYAPLPGGTLHFGLFVLLFEVRMSSLSARRLRLVCWAGLAAGALLVVAGPGCRRRVLPPPPATRPALSEAEITEQVHNFCGTSCHAYPPPDSFPRWAWKQEVERGFRFFEKSGLPLKAPPIQEVVRYYEKRAPEALPHADIVPARHPLPVRFEKTGWPGPKVRDTPSISFVDFVHLSDRKRKDLLACDMRNGHVMALSPWHDAPAWRVLAQLEHPAHAEVVDLDGDGILDLLVADLGSYLPTERRCGKVVWLRGQKDGTFKPITLLDNVGRVADVQAGHFRSKDRLDLVVAVFGLNQTGEVLFLENRTTDWSKPMFTSRVIDQRTGAIHVPVADLDGDGRPDFLVLLSQEHEVIVAYLNEGNGKFRAHTIYRAPHPGYGSSGIQLVDINGDGKPDILYTNGDVLDEPYLFKPYHSVQWLENKGGLKFEHHPIAPMYGIHRAVAGPITGSGRMDIAAVSFLPVEGFPDRKKRKADAVVVFEQTALGKFARHSLATVDCDHVSCVLGDVFGTGRLDLVVGNFGSRTEDRPVLVWRNLGKGTARRDEGGPRRAAERLLTLGRSLR